jgi:oligopeptide transport system permease protein
VSTARENAWLARGRELAAAGTGIEPRASPLARALQSLRADRVARACLISLGVLALASLFAPLLPLRSPSELHLSIEPEPPTPPWVELGDAGWDPGAIDELAGPDRWLGRLRHALFGTWQTGSWLGRDAKGRDLLARLVWGSRVSLQVALFASLVSLVVGVLVGSVAGYAGGWLDELLMRLVDALSSLPFVFVVIFVLTLLNQRREALGEAAGASRTTVFFVVLGLFWWLTLARVVRARVQALRRAEFVLAARALGASHAWVLARHVLPNAWPIVIVYSTLTLPSVLLFEAFLSFLGLGVEPPAVSWGLLAADAAEALSPLRVDWWLVLFPSLTIAGTLLALNLLGDALRDALDPHATRRAP